MQCVYGVTNPFVYKTQNLVTESIYSTTHHVQSSNRPVNSAIPVAMEITLYVTKVSALGEQTDCQLSRTVGDWLLSELGITGIVHRSIFDVTRQKYELMRIKVRTWEHWFELSSQSSK